MDLGFEDNFVWLLLILLFVVFIVGKQGFFAPPIQEQQCECEKEQPVYIYRNPRKDRPRRRLCY